MREEGRYPSKLMGVDGIFLLRFSYLYLGDFVR